MLEICRTVARKYRACHVADPLVGYTEAPPVRAFSPGVVSASLALRGYSFTYCKLTNAPFAYIVLIVLNCSMSVK